MVAVAGVCIEEGRGPDRLVRRDASGKLRTSAAVIHPMLIFWELGA